MSLASRAKLDALAGWLKTSTVTSKKQAAEEARRYGEAVDKAGNLYDGFGNVVGKVNPKVQGAAGDQVATGKSAAAGRPATVANGYNQGKDEDRRKALDSIYDYIKTLITLATGTIALSATFLAKDMPHSKGVWWLISSWIVLGASILMGIIGMGQYISQYAESSIKPRHSGAEYLSLVQVLALWGGLACLAYFAVQNVG